jgi:tripartite-type tricarboxylate transporter receptor subunit TctC
MIRSQLFAVSAALCALVAAPAFAQDDYPNRPVRLVVGFPPGSSGDLLSRAVTARLSQTIGQQIVV